MATIINARQKELIALVNTQKVYNTYTPYTKMFKEVNAPILSGRTDLLLEDLVNTNYEAKTFPRNSSATILQKQSHMRLSLRPPMLGHQMTVDTLSSLEKGAGEPIVIIDGQAVNGTDYEVEDKVNQIKKTIVNGLESMASEVFVTSKITNLNINFDLNGDSTKGDLTVTPADGETVMAGIVKKVLDYQKTNKIIPSVSIGINAFNQLTNEIDSAAGKLSLGDYKVNKVTGANEEYFEVTVEKMAITMRLLSLAKEYEGSDINTDDLIILHHGSTIGVGYAILGVPDSARKTTIPVRSEFVAFEGDYNANNLAGSINVHSAPLPFIMDNTLLWRYNLVIA